MFGGGLAFPVGVPAAGCIPVGPSCFPESGRRILAGLNQVCFRVWFWSDGGLVSHTGQKCFLAEGQRARTSVRSASVQTMSDQAAVL